MTTVRPLDAADRPALEGFLGARIAESMFLLSNLREAGFGEREHRLSGRHVGCFDAGELVGVGVHLRMGNLILNAPNHAVDVARAALALTRRPLHAIVGPEDQVDAVTDALRTPTGAQVQVDEREGLYRLELDALRVPEALRTGAVRGRAPTLIDLEPLVEQTFRYRVESIGDSPTRELRAMIRASLPEEIERGDVWVLEVDGRIVAKTAFNARLPGAVQIGGVWTPHALRGRGYARCVVASHLLAARAWGVLTAILFTGDDNVPAQRVYAALGFELVGRYRVLVFRSDLSALV